MDHNEDEEKRLAKSLYLIAAQLSEAAIKRTLPPNAVLKAETRYDVRITDLTGKARIALVAVVGDKEVEYTSYDMNPGEPQ